MLKMAIVYSSHGYRWDVCIVAMSIVAIVYNGQVYSGHCNTDP